MAIKITSFSSPPLRSGQTIVSFSNQVKLPLPTIQVVKLGLKKGLSLTASQYKDIIKSSFLYQLKNRALRSLAARPQAPQILKQKLKIFLQKKQNLYSYSVSPADQSKLIGLTLRYLKSKNLLSLSNYLDYFLKKHQDKSPRHLKFLLQKQGISPHLIPPRVLLGSQTAKIKKLILKKVKQPQNLSDYKTKNKIISYLSRRGFAYGSIKRAIDEIKLFS